MQVETLIGIALIGIVVGSMLDGFRRGVFSILAPVAAFIGAIIISGYNPSIAKLSTAETAKESFANIITQLQSWLSANNFASFLNPDTITDFIKNGTDSITSAYISEAHTLIVFAFAYIVIYALVASLSGIMRTNIATSSLNSLAGVAAGFIIGILRIWIDIALITVLAALIPPIKDFITVCLGNELFAYMYLHNPLI